MNHMNDIDLDRLRLDCPEGHHRPRNRAERRRQRYSPDATPPLPWVTADWTAIDRPNNYRTNRTQRR